MRGFLVVAVLFALGGSPAEAAPAYAPSPPATATPKPACIGPQNSADYAPGIDAYGHPVAPADLAGSADVQINTEVFPIVRTQNPQLDGVGVDVNLPGLQTRPLCPPGSAKSPAAKRK